MSTRISLKTGGTLVVPEGIEDVQCILTSGKPHVFHPEFHRSARGEDLPPEPIALRIEHVGMLADATVRRRRGSHRDEPAQLESASDGPTFTDLFESNEDYERWKRDRYGPAA